MAGIALLAAALLLRPGTAVLAGTLAAPLLRLLLRRLLLAFSREHAEDARKQTITRLALWCGLGRLQDGDGGRFDRLALENSLWRLRFRCGLGQRVAGAGILRKLHLVVTHATYFVMRCLERGIGDQYHLHLVA